MTHYLKLACIFILLTSKLSASTNVDIWNNYQWNRKNALEQNGKVPTTPWFEWWYYKITLPEKNRSYFFVYGIINPWDTEQIKPASRSYVGMGDFYKKTQVEEVFSPQDFHASYQKTFIEIKNNVATDKYLKGSLTDKAGGNYLWDIKIEKKWSFNAESFLLGKNISSIEWYPAQADARCEGFIQTPEEKIEFKDTPCYQDRNWGSAFPKWWAWIVSNKFDQYPDTTLAIGGGKPKILNNPTPFASVGIGLRHQGREYLFRPQHLTKINMNISYGKWEISANNGTHTIELSASAPKEDFMDLKFLTPDNIIFHDYETLNGNLKLKLYKNYGLMGKKLIVELTSSYAGIEYGSANEYFKEL